MASAPSPLDVLRERYAQLAAAPEPMLYLPIHHGVEDVAVQYREQDWQATQAARARWRGSDHPKAKLYESAEYLAGSCVDVHLRDGENGVKIGDLDGLWSPGLAADQGRLSFVTAASVLGLDIGGAGEIGGVSAALRATVAVLRSDWEVVAHSDALAMWMPEPSPEVGKDFVGESPAGTPA